MVALVSFSHLSKVKQIPDGYRFSRTHSPDSSYTLPALWFNAGEALALLSMQNLLVGLDEGILSNHIRPLQARLKALLETSEYPADEVQKRIRIAGSNMRMLSPDCFETIAKATLGRQRIMLRHVSRMTDEESEWIVSPQRLTFDRSVWYLDAWCHLRNAIRRFAIDAIRFAELTGERATEISPELLDEAIESSYEVLQQAWSVERRHPQSRQDPEVDGVYFVGTP